ncbi:DNA cytosine methyltransferase [Paenibacillus sp. NPDC056579]|uniref:DNA cytosine methyltransferase n=1 Tax=Paenibacillus sp. NPDC056579 TaxID=3345871 RepID=UPI0036A817E5
MLFENVPSFYSSSSYLALKELLNPIYPYAIGPIQIDSYDFGSIAHRNRSYVVYLREKEDFENFRVPKAPVFRRLKLRDYLDSKGAVHEWKSVSTWFDSFASKGEKNNSWALRSTKKTFVHPESCTEIQCIPRRYRSQSASNSYVLNDEGTHWRFLTVSELRRIFHIPKWFEFPSYIPVYRMVEMIGQSICGLVVRAFANEIASMFVRRNSRAASARSDSRIEEKQYDTGLTRDHDGQIGFVFA